jgi:hypothetical protein
MSSDDGKAVGFTPLSPAEPFAAIEILPFNRSIALPYYSRFQPRITRGTPLLAFSWNVSGIKPDQHGSIAWREMRIAWLRNSRITKTSVSFAKGWFDEGFEFVAGGFGRWFLCGRMWAAERAGTGAG